MKKKIVSTMLCATMIATMLAGCGGSDNGGSAATDNGGSTEEAAPAGDSADSSSCGRRRFCLLAQLQARV